MLARRAHALAGVPVVFEADGRRWKLQPNRLGIQADWAAAVAAAQGLGDGSWPFRGLRRMRLRLLGHDVSPRTEVWTKVLAYRLAAIARTVDQPHRDAAVKLRGLRVLVVPGQDGVVLDRDRAEAEAVDALASLERNGAVPLPIRRDPQRVSADDLADAAADTRTAISAPVRLALGPTRWRIPRWRIAKLLLLPSDGETELRIGGTDADRFFARLSRRVNRPARDADFAISSANRVSVVPAHEGRALNRDETSKRLLAAALSPSERLAGLVVATDRPERTTEEARAMGITGLVGAYETIYGGDPNRLHNVRLVAQLIDRTLIAPGEVFSFNETTGARTPEKGFREAPVIINGELQTGIGGGVCQVSTTVFNAAYEAGLAITSRTNHALYISHYPQGRDATVNYPDTDLRFVNDTGRWLLLRTFVGSSSLTVALYGRPTGRRVETETQPLTVTGGIPVKRIADPTMYEGETVTEEYGEPSRRTSVHRLVYAPDGRLLHDDTWYSSYSAEPTVIRYGTKPRPAPEPQPQPKREKEPKPSQDETQPSSGAQADTDSATPQP